MENFKIGDYVKCKDITFCQDSELILNKIYKVIDTYEEACVPNKLIPCIAVNSLNTHYYYLSSKFTKINKLKLKFRFAL